MNFMKETLHVLKEKNYTVDEILWIGTRKWHVKHPENLEFLNVDYDPGYGTNEISMGLVIVMEDYSWFTRQEYDGSEWWSHHSMPTARGESKSINDVTPDMFMQRDYDYLD